MAYTGDNNRSTKKTAEEEIFETWKQIEEQDSRWKATILRIMEQYGLSSYPERKHFLMSGNKATYKEISDFATHEYVADIMKIETPLQNKLRQIIFDIMDSCEINYFPEEVHFRSSKSTKMYHLINKVSSMENERSRLNLKTKSEYESLVSRKRAK